MAMYQWNKEQLHALQEHGITPDTTAVSTAHGALRTALTRGRSYAGPIRLRVESCPRRWTRRCDKNAEKGLARGFDSSKDALVAVSEEQGHSGIFHRVLRLLHLRHATTGDRLRLTMVQECNF